MQTFVLVTIGVLFVTTVLYRLLPFRTAGDRRPFLALLPKYKKRIVSSESDQALEEKLARYGFRKTKQRGATASFTRGSVLGDLSIELAKVDVGLIRLNDKALEITVQAGWVAAFDTGDHWKLITELGRRLENTQPGVPVNDASDAW